MTIEKTTAGVAEKPSPIGHNSQGSADPIATEDHPISGARVSVEEIGIWAPIAARADDMTDADLDGEIQLLKDFGQRLPVVVRLLKNGRYEAVLRSHLVRVVREHNSRPDHEPLDVEVQVTRMDDSLAFRHAAQELEPGADVSSLARSRFFDEAVRAQRSQKKAAQVCRISEAALSKILDVGRAAKIIGDKVTITRDISQRDATWLMELVGRDKKTLSDLHQENRTLIRSTLDAMEPKLAKAVFAELRAVFKPAKQRKGFHPLTHEGTDIGHLLRSSKGLIKIELKAAGDIEPDVLADLIGNAIGEARR